MDDIKKVQDISVAAKIAFVPEPPIEEDTDEN